MNHYSSSVSFVDELKKTIDGLDCAMLNAGGVNTHFVESLEGW